MDQQRTKILVDGNCIVCDWEISHYKAKAPELFDIVDISHPDFDPAKYNLTTEAVNLNLHVLTPDGQLKVGVDAFAHIWSRLESYKKFSTLIKAPVIHPLAKAGYKLFTKVRPFLPKKVAKT